MLQCSFHGFGEVLSLLGTLEQQLKVRQLPDLQ